jgi:hypothetical protein
VHRNVGYQNSWFHVIGNPTFVRGEDEVRILVDGPVTGTYEDRVETSHGRKVFLDKTPEGHHDFGIVPLRRSIDPLAVIGVDFGGGVMGTQKIAREQNAVFHQKR